MICNTRSVRKGAVAPFAAIISVVMIAMIAFAVDVGWMVTTNNHLQNAADSAALAGADPLMDGFVKYQYVPTNQKSTVLQTSLVASRALAKKFAGYNAAGGKSSLALRDEDIEFGFTDQANKYTPLPQYTGFPNTIKVKMRRDELANGSLNLFFAPVMGNDSADLFGTASATIMGGKIDGFSVTTPRNIAMLPMTYDIDFWNQFLINGKTHEGKQFVDANGLPKLWVYSSNRDKGNFGLLSLNDTHNGTSEIRPWIHEGLGKSDISTLQANGLIPLSQSDPNAWDWNGDNGFRSVLVSDVNQYLGETFVLPLFRAKNSSKGNNYQAGVGEGSDYDYNIVEFVGVTIAEPDKENQQIFVQPAPYVDPNAVFTSQPVPAGTTVPGTNNDYIMTTFTTPKLSR
jgi:hypothetical protein